MLTTRPPTSRTSTTPSARPDLPRLPGVDRASISSALLADLARLPYVQAFKVGQRDMSNTPATSRPIRDADATKAILTCHDEYLSASMVQGVDGALVGFASAIPQLIIDLLERR